MATGAQSALKRESQLCNGINPWLAPLATVFTQDLALPFYFQDIQILGRQHLPTRGPVLLAPTHRSRWDALLMPQAVGRRFSGRDSHFMVTVNEMRGLQGWFLQRLGCFPVNQGRPSLASLRYAVDLLKSGNQLVVFPEGGIRSDDGPIRLHQGLARLAMLAASQGVDVPVLPVGIAYSHHRPRFRDRTAVALGQPLWIRGQGREAAQALTGQLAAAMGEQEHQARGAIDFAA
ncbi:1-acyl-sn-glycerol-3-phosphate acyltransferase [Cyanobium sp. HWJ4-Hawea]|nr:1-acyl-sn-glycerol-3-phosphate acyltransferase [Cyanobium sp. WAJ14-Wanaka]MCP9808218.1 1-acyl-sn-glycerol-3-phosphate acyltransferase [Cyanobium sp. HWJ4-Hawea]